MPALAVILQLLLEVPIAVVTTLLAVRLLGQRRSWVAITLAGVIGWLSADLLQVALADWDWDAARLSVTTVALATVLTMLAAVTIDFVARPGSLARGERSGLLVLPRPIRDLRRRLEPYARYREILAVARRNGLSLPGGARRRRRRGEERVPVPVAVRQTLEQLGVVFVKLGQMASTRDDLVPKDVIVELRRLQSGVEPMPREEMQAQLEAELDGPTDRFFAEFDWVPIGSASIAQAYAARLTSGEPVVVKVQRPGITGVMERDTTALMHLAGAVESRTPQGKDLRVAEIADEFVLKLREELDFPREAANAVDLAAATDPGSGVRIPRIHRDLLTAGVLVQERFIGESVARRSRIAELGIDEEQLADRLVATMVAHMFTYGHYHADPHPGNVLLLDDGTLGLIDFGSTGHLDPIQRTALLEMTVAAFRGDGAALRDGIEQVAVIGADLPPAALERALSRYMSENLRPGQDLGVAAFEKLIPLLATFDIRMPQELTLFFRALVLLDGTARTIRPGYSLVDGMRRLLDGQVPEAPVAATVQEELLQGLMLEIPRLRRLPAQVDRIATLTSRGELRHRVALFSSEQDARVVITLVNRMVLGVGGGLLAIASALLLLAGSSAGAATSITRVFGFVGLAAGAALILRAVAAIVREGYN